MCKTKVGLLTVEEKEAIEGKRYASPSMIQGLLTETQKGSLNRNLNLHSHQCNENLLSNLNFIL